MVRLLPCGSYLLSQLNRLAIFATEAVDLLVDSSTRLRANLVGFGTKLAPGVVDLSPGLRSISTLLHSMIRLRILGSFARERSRGNDKWAFE
jgi:hypothetical protein